MRTVMKLIYIALALLTIGCQASNPTRFSEPITCPGFPPANEFGIAAGNLLSFPDLINAHSATSKGEWSKAEKHYKEFLEWAETSSVGDNYRKYAATALYHALCMQGKQKEARRISTQYDLVQERGVDELDQNVTEMDTINYSEEVRNLHNLAEKNNADAQIKLGYMYNRGQGVKQDLTEGAYWMRKAAEQSNKEAQYNLCKSYYYGWGVPEDYIQAHKWCTLAVQEGYTGARDFLYMISQRMTAAQITEANRLTMEWRVDKGKAVH